MQPDPSTSESLLPLISAYLVIGACIAIYRLFKNPKPCLCRGCRDNDWRAYKDWGCVLCFIFYYLIQLVGCPILWPFVLIKNAEDNI